MAEAKRMRGRPREYTETQAIKLGNDILTWFNANPQEWTIEAWVEHHVLETGDIFMSTDKLIRLAKAYPDTFGRIYKGTICNKQVRRMQDMTAKGAMPPALGIFLLKNRGYSDKQEVEHSGEMGFNLTINTVADDDNLDD